MARSSPVLLSLVQVMLAWRDVTLLGRHKTQVFKTYSEMVRGRQITNKHKLLRTVALKTRELDFTWHTMTPMTCFCISYIFTFLPGQVLILSSLQRPDTV